MASLDLLGHVEATELAPGVFVATARGPMDGRVVGELRDVLVPLAAADGSVVVLDLIDAHCLDDEALAVISLAAHLARRRGDRLRVATAIAGIVSVIREWGLDELVTIYGTVREALGRD